MFTLRIAALVSVCLGAFIQHSDAAELAADPDVVKKARVAVLVFPGVELLDFSGPGEVFAAARQADNTRLFDVYTVGISKTAIKSTQFLSITPQYDPSDAPAPEILVIPGGGVESAMNNAPLCAWIERCAKEECLLFSVCNGATILGKLGFLDRLDVATHHDNFAILQLLAPTIVPRPDRKFVDNGKVITAAGISSGIDAALYLVSRIHGAETARATATYIEYDHWSGFDTDGRHQPSADERGVVSLPGRIHETQSWQLLKLIACLRSEGTEKALAQYPDWVHAAAGIDRQMLSQDGLRMSADWLLKHGRERQIALAILEFCVAAFPQSVAAHLDLGKALLETGDKAQAKVALEKALALDPENKAVLRFLERCK